jgi:WD40 repeat protein
MLTLHGHTGPVWALAYAPDGRLLASGGADRTLRLWDVPARRELALFLGHTNTIVVVAFAPDGRSLASVGRDRHVRLWDVTAGRERGELPRQTVLPTSAAFFPDGRSLAVGGGLITGLAVSPDGSTVAVGSGYPMYVTHGTVRVWDVETGTESAGLDLSDMGHWSARYPRAGRRVELGGGIRGVKLWQPGGDRPLTALPHRHPVLAVAFSPDGATLATAAGPTVRLWDAATGGERLTLRGHRRDAGSVTALAFTPDGAALLSGSIDRSVRLWDVAVGRPRKSYGWPVGKVYAVAVAPDGLTAAAAGASPDIVVWDLESM